MGIQEDGIEMEQWILNEFRQKKIHCFQPDAISLEDGVYILNEVKHQEYFRYPPFDGHGLPRWQVEARMKFYKTTGIRIRLVIKEKGSNIIYSQYLDVLEAGEKYDTFGAKPRRVYPLHSYKKRQA